MSDDERRIRELVQSWMAASKAADLPALLDMMTDDVVFMTPGRPSFGKSEWVEMSERMRGAKLDGRAEVIEVETFGLRAYARIRVEVVLTPPGGSPRRMSGYSMSILRKEADGRWRIARDANLVTPESA
jgi:uncharacterized protein (TIGR02246 family)